MHGNDSWWRGGGVLSFLFFAAELSSAFSFLIFVILANAETHRTASAVARFWHFIIRVAGGADLFSHTVILANAGTHRIASTVARF
ncbi:putative membrane protein [Vibrio vulnificus]|nr:putative membrane protein [Vibrio vulnificus]OQK68076.1 putative membrane protein [Vibrio vulnificus]